MKNTDSKELQKQLCFEYEHISNKQPQLLAEAQTFCEGYKHFLDVGKTERECVNYSVDMLVKNGYKPFDANATAPLKAGDKVYYINRDKSIIASTIGSLSVEEGLHLNIAHIDSPRLDLKANPLFEKRDLAYFKTHYYGGIRKYQWTCIPLSVHGVVYTADGTKIDIVVGENEGEPNFCITDLLPHLAQEQNKRTLGDGIRGEELNAIVGSIPYADNEVKNPVKLCVLKHLYDTYGMTEKDFVRSEIELVPATKAMDIGFDRSIVGAAGQDDRVCAYTALIAEIEAMPKHTSVTVFADKEEIGSIGNTGLNSDFLKHYIQQLAALQNADYITTVKNSKCMSSDVNAALDPTFESVYEDRNSSFMNRGCVISKYTGARGKSGSNDASAELMQSIIGMLDADNVAWQTGELGAVDAGGGGTVAKEVARMDIDVVDVGVPVLSMHSPLELCSKLDVYSAYLAYKAFFKN